MHDSELKKLLLETCPVRPGQEARAWNALRDRLYKTHHANNLQFSWRSILSWQKVTIGGLAAVGILVFAGTNLVTRPLSFASADSEAPGIFATSFYSSSARAQVVWLNGLEPATDQPTYQDPTTVIPGLRKSSKPAGDPNSL